MKEHFNVTKVMFSPCMDETTMSEVMQHDTHFL